jgi:T-complex protein 1 subunit alpha
MLDEMERSIHDSLSIVKRTLESNMVVAGGGAVEAALSVYLENLATTLGSREQLAVVEFALALLVIPKVLAVNAAKDATELVAKLCAYHHNAQTKADKQHLSGYVPTDSSKKLLLCTLKVHFNKVVREWSSIHREAFQHL